MDDNVKVLNMLEKGKLSLKDAEKLLKAMNYNDDFDLESLTKTKKTKVSKKPKTMQKKVTKAKKKTKKKSSKIPQAKKNTVISYDNNGNLLINGKSVGEEGGRPYQKDRDSGR